MQPSHDDTAVTSYNPEFIMVLDTVERPLFFSVNVRKYRAQFAHRQNDYSDVIIRVEHTASYRSFLNYDEVVLPIYLLDALLDRATRRNQRSSLDWRELCDYFGWQVHDESAFKYHTYRREGESTIT